MYKVIACSADKAADGIALALRAGVPQGHGDGPVPSHGPRRAELAHDRRAARRGAPGGGGQAPQRQRRALHVALRSGAHGALHARSRRARLLHRGAGGPRQPHGGVWIDVSHLGAKVVETNFRGMVKRCRDFGRDLARGTVEVGPTAHFMIGGAADDRSTHDRQRRDGHPRAGRRGRRALCRPARGRPLRQPRDRRGRQGPARPGRMHAHGPGRLQRGADAARLDRRALPRHPRGRRVDQRSGARVDARERGARPRARARGALRLLLRPPPRRRRSTRSPSPASATTARSTRAISPASRS